MSEQKNAPQKTESRSALVRLLIVILVLIAALIYSYGWTVTEINLDHPQEELRQTNVTRALRELLSPRIFDQARELETFETSFLMGCDTGDAPAQADPTNSSVPVITVEPACADSGDVVTVKVFDASPGADARLRWQPPDSNGEAANERPLELLETGREDFVIAGDGTFEGTVEVPRIRGGQGQLHTIRLLVAQPAGPITFSDTANQVIERMAETIFIALIATTVAIPIAALISFFAARNLMKRVKLSVGSMLLTFIMVVIGFGFGSAYFTGFAQLAVTTGKAGLVETIAGSFNLDLTNTMLVQFIDIVLAFLIPILVLFGTGFLLRQLAKMYPQETKRDAEAPLAGQILNTLITSVVLIFMFGAISGLAILIGDGIASFANSLRPAEISGALTWSQNAFADTIWSLGNDLHIIGQLVELLMSGIVGIITGIALSGIVGAIFGNTVRRIYGPAHHILGAILGAISGAILLALMASLGLWAALLGVLPLLFGGILGGQVLLQLFSRLQKQDIRTIRNSQKVLNWFVFAAGFMLAAYYLFNQLGFARSMIDGTLPPQNTVFGLPITSYMFYATLTGAVLGGLSGFMSGVQGTFPLGNVLYNTSRTILNIVRSIEPLIMGLVFVIWVGIGPFAGVLALTLHSIAALGKLYSEQIENIDPGPLEALQSTGANQLQAIIYAVVPQIVPPYIAFTMYRWDINVRMSTIIGFVGGGGIGLLLQQQINLLRYRDAGVAVLAIAVVVSILDYASATIRERLT